ncbi:hypothetical protein EBQ25_04815 [Allofranklinella schreckenbergeri]|uniref:PTS EIIA type-4 domain-containing protein n=1 Tax=Allofranklinella schreckenbergeri TaxID=1076744 RepID=A0A3M6QD07_9BURK|nr:hypothetical protein [Allofranklinella schreckenbergeri]RMX00521.1 hypothetical protein EBQ25_04815 [Allofranklinella schreckenbergeri]
MNSCRIFIVAHAPLASALKACAEHVFADAAADVQALDVLPEHDSAFWQVQADALLLAPRPGFAAADAAQPPAPVLLLTDIIGATPYNVACALAAHAAQAGLPACVLTGANLPMLLRAITYRHESLPDLAERASSGAVQSITCIQP